MMRRCAGLNADEAWRQLLEECQDITSLQLPADDHVAYHVDAVNLKNRLGDVETNCSDRLHARLLRLVVTPSATTFRGIYVPVKEPSTASGTDFLACQVRAWPGRTPCLGRRGH